MDDERGCAFAVVLSVLQAMLGGILLLSGREAKRHDKKIPVGDTDNDNGSAADTDLPDTAIR